MIPDQPIFVWIEWDDTAAYTSSWTPLKQATQEAYFHPCISVGVLLVEDEDKIAIVQSFTTDPRADKQLVDGQLTIPRVAVRLMKKLSVQSEEL